MIMKFVSHYQQKKFNEQKRWWSCFVIVSSDCLPSTRDVSNVVVAAFRRPAGRLTPIFSNLFRRSLPPFFDLALVDTKRKRKKLIRKSYNSINTIKNDENEGRVRAKRPRASSLSKKKKTKVRVPRPNWVDISTEYQTHHSLWGMQTVFFSFSSSSSPFLAFRTVLKRHPITTHSDIRALPDDVALRRWSLCTSMSNWAKPIGREPSRTDRSETESRHCHCYWSRNTSKRRTLNLVVDPNVDHLEGGDRKNTGGWMRRCFLVFPSVYLD